MKHAILATVAALLLAAPAHAETYYLAEIPGGYIELTHAPCRTAKGRIEPRYSQAKLFEYATGRIYLGCWGIPNTGEFAMVFDQRGAYVFQPYEFTRMQR